MKSIQTFSLIVFGVLGLLLAGGCSSQKSPELMMPSKLRVTHQYKQKIGLDVTVSETLAQRGWAKRFVADKERFREAIKRTIERDEIFEDVGPRDSGAMELEVMISDIPDPAIAGDMTVGLKTNWSLRLRGFAKSVWQEEIFERGQATVAEDPVADNRTDHAGDRAAAATIRHALESLSKASLIDMGK